MAAIAVDIMHKGNIRDDSHIKTAAGALGVIVAAFSLSSFITSACAAASCNGDTLQNARIAAAFFGAFAALIGFVTMILKMVADCHANPDHTCWSVVASALTVTWLTAVSTAVSNACAASNACADNSSNIVSAVFTACAVVVGVLIAVLKICI